MEEEEEQPKSTEENNNGARMRKKKSSLDEVPSSSTPPNSSENSSPDSTPAKRSTNKHDDTSVRSATDHTAAQRVEEKLSSLQLMSKRDVQSPTITSRLQEFEKKEDMKTEEDSTEELHQGATIRRRRVNPASTEDVQQEASRSSLLEPGIRELAELPWSPLPSHSVRELAGFPKSSLQSASIQELAEHHQLNPPDYKQL